MTESGRNRRLFPLLVALFFVSGATALVYQVAWLRALLLIFGSGAFAITTVLASFMAGFAAGSYAGGRWVDRRGSPILVYAVLELGIALYALMALDLFGVIDPFEMWVSTRLGSGTGILWVRFALCFAVLFFPAALMGGTLPALARFCAGLPHRLASGVGGLYGVNTVGAFVGTIGTGFWLLPRLGLEHTIQAAAVANLLVVAGALALHLWTLRPRAWAPENPAAASAGPSRAVPPLPAVEAAPTLRTRRRAIVAALAVTGAAALALEVAWTRVLALILGPSVYSFSLMTGTFLMGLGLGGVLLSIVIARSRQNGLALLAGVSGMAGLLSFVTLMAFHRLPFTYASLFQRLSEGGSPDPATLFGIGLLLSGAVMLPPTLAMGALFPAAVLGLDPSPKEAGREVGRLYAANSAGAIVGALAAGFVSIPLIGLQGTVLLAVVLYLGVAGGVARLALAGRRWAWGLPAGALVGSAALIVAAPSWNRLLMSSGVYQYAARYETTAGAADFERVAEAGHEELFYEEGRVSAVLVAKERGAYGRLGSETVPNLLLISNGKVDASSVVDMPTQILSAHLPLLLHPAPRHALVIGLGSGTTAGSALQHDLESLDVVEIEPAVVEASRFFDFVSGRPLDDPRTRLVLEDGRVFLRRTDRRFDVIVSVPSNPWITGVSNLFTTEFFELVRDRLKPQGIFGQWVQTYGMSTDNLALLLRTYQSVFPYTVVFSTIPGTDLFVVGATHPIRIDPVELERRLSDPRVRADLQRIGIRHAARLLARGRMGPRELSAFAGAGPLNTDDNARLEFAAPLDLLRPTRIANEHRIEVFARGLAPYLRGLDTSEDRDFLLELAAEYARLGWYREAGTAHRAASRAAAISALSE